MGTVLVAIILIVVFVLAFRATAKEMKKGGCAYCSACASHRKPGKKQPSDCTGECAACSRRCH